MEDVMNPKESLLIHSEDVDPQRRPKLYDMLSIVEGYAYLLSSEGLSNNPEDTRLLIFIMSPGTCGLIEDSPASVEGGSDEYYHAIVLDDVSLISLRTLISPPQRIRKESTGRPPKYSLAKEGQEIFKQYTEEGIPIKRIAKERRMSPTTVQKLLNLTRLQAVEEIVAGAAPPTEENLKLLRWAAEHGDEDRQEVYRELLNKLDKLQKQ
ncbi:MAG: hypothetical protein IJ849_01015 [Selenomonadaceae bacterium]|nr:hypothetical protein [Selenomonadaceae bacterium]